MKEKINDVIFLWEIGKINVYELIQNIKNIINERAK